MSIPLFLHEPCSQALAAIAMTGSKGNVPALTHAPNTQPSPKADAPSRSVTILHLSDVQFGKNHRFGRLGLPPPDDTFDSLLRRITDDLDGLKTSHGLQPDLICVTGDLAEWGRKSEFDDAFEFVDGVCKHVGLPRERVTVIPGNHDINRKLCESYFLACEANEQSPSPPYWPKWEPYVKAAAAFFVGIPGFHFDDKANEPWSLFPIHGLKVDPQMTQMDTDSSNIFPIPDLKVVVAGLNSTMRESHQKKDHYGWVGEAQLRWFAQKLDEYREKGWLRIACIHHNVQRGAESDDENLRDSDDLKRLLGEHVNLVLHGHTHEGKLGWLSQYVPIISTGSAALKVKQRPDEVPNQYQIIQVRANGFTRYGRRFDPGQKRWIADPRINMSGNDWIEDSDTPFRCAPDMLAMERTSSETSHDLLSGTELVEVLIRRTEGVSADLVKSLQDILSALSALPGVSEINRIVAHSNEVLLEVKIRNGMKERFLRSIQESTANQYGRIWVNAAVLSGPATTEEAIQQELQGYELINFIGQGGFGTVWLAVERITGRYRAVKVLPKAAVQASPGRNLAERELAALKLVIPGVPTGSHLINIIYAGETKAFYYYVMEAADSVTALKQGDRFGDKHVRYAPLTLAYLIKHNAPMPARRSLNMIADLLKGLAHLHERNLMHRDVKPSNILFVEGVLKLGDVGLVAGLDRDVTVAGTSGYVPWWDSSFDRTADVYACGLILYELLTGFDRERFPVLSPMPMTNRSEIQLLRAAIRIMTKATSRDQRKRYESAGDMLRAVNAAIQPRCWLPGLWRKHAP